MRTSWTAIGFAALLGLVGCDNKEPDLGIKETKSIYDLKQEAKTDKTQEELEEARRKAGFKSHEEQIEEAKAQYEKMERGYVKGRAERYKELLASARAKLDKIEKAAPSWAKAKNPDKAVESFKTKYDEELEAFRKEYDDLSEKGSRGGNLQSDLETVVSALENLGNDLGPQLAEAEQFQTTLKAVRDQIDAIETLIEEIEADESIEAEEVAEDAEGGEKKKKAG